MKAWAMPGLAAPFHPDVLDDLWPKCVELATEFSDLGEDFDLFLPQCWKGCLVGADPGAGGRKNRSERAASMGLQQGTHLSRNGLQMLIPEAIQDVELHVRLARGLDHPFVHPVALPLDLQFAAAKSYDDPAACAKWRRGQWGKIKRLAHRCAPLDAEIRNRMTHEVAISAGSLRLGLLSVLLTILRWPDWQLTSLFTRGFRVAGCVEPSNVYPRIATGPCGEISDIIGTEEADKWNCSLARDLRPSEFDASIYDTAMEQSSRGLLSRPLSKEEVDARFGRGNWRGIRRRGISQNNKVRGIDNALTSRTNFAAFLQDTITTSAADIGMQVVCWLLNGEQGIARARARGLLWTGLSSDDLADAYHGVPNSPDQLRLCVVAIRHPNENKMIFFVSNTHLFGLTAAVVNFNRLPELMTAACRRLGACPSWHYFDDQGTLDFAERQGSSRGSLADGNHKKPGGRGAIEASDFVGRLYKLVGRPFKPVKHQPANERQVHLGLLNVFEDMDKQKIWLEAKPGKLEELEEAYLEMVSRRPQVASLRQVMQLAGKLLFLTMNVFDKMARGGLQPFYSWLAENVGNSADLNKEYKISSSLAVGLEFFHRGLRVLKPRIFHLAQVSRRPVVIYSDAEWEVLDKAPWISKGLGGIAWIDETTVAASVEAPDELVEALSPRKTQIIPLELMAAAGMIHTYGESLRGRDVLFFIDNQSVCCALTKGCSRSWDIQIMCTSWHLACLRLGCRVWIEWVPSHANPADVLSREHRTPYELTSGFKDELEPPAWVDMRGPRSISEILGRV